MMNNTETSKEENKAAKQELAAGFEGETITLKEAMDLSEKSKVTILKLIKDKELAPVGKVVSGGRGRPANLYDRAELLAALHTI